MLRLLPADLTLVINLSAGDAAYAHFTASALIKAHRKTAKEVIIILDDTKAQYSDFYDHKKRYAEPLFSEKLRTVTAIAENIKQEKLADTIIPVSCYLDKNLNKKYLNNRVKQTHDFRGAPITAYLAGFEACKTQFLVRYDGDMLLHQSEPDWALKGIKLLQQHADAVAVSPLPSPPLPTKNFNTPFDPTYWFSTRCTLFDTFKLRQTIPLIGAKYYAEVLLRKWMQKTYPPAFETMLCHRLKKYGLKNYYLLNNKSWLLHPEEKNEIFIDLLTQIIASVKKGDFPLVQADNETLDLTAWENFLKLSKA